MRICNVARLATLAVCVGLSVAGCSSGTDIQVATPTGEIKPNQGPAPGELKGDAKRAVGPGTSANIGKLGKNPMDMAK